MSKNAIPLDRLQWVRLSRDDRDVFRTWSTDESRERPQPQRVIEKGPVFGRRVLGPVAQPEAPSLRRKGTAD